MELSNLKTNLEWALYYLSIGWNPIPVNGKKPRLGSWKEYQTQRVTEAEIRTWWTRWPDAGIAIITGKISGIVVVDIDPGGKIDGLTPTVASRTGRGGKHCLYKYPKGGVGCANGMLEHVDFRGDGGYVVVPPSRHQSGKFYEWTTEPNLDLLAELPEHIVALVRKNNKPLSQDWDQKLSGVSEGSRNSTAASYTGKMLHELSPNLWETAGWDALLAWNERNTPPLDRVEIKGVWDSIKSREILHRKDKTRWKKIFKKSKPTVLYEVARFLVEKHHIKTIGEKVREPYIYKDGIYLPGTNHLKNEVEILLEERSSMSIKNEVLDKVKDLTPTDRDIFYKANIDLINLRNGILNVRTLQIEPHTPKHLFLNQIPVDFNPKADCPNINKFLSEILEEVDVSTIQEWFGYCLYRRYFVKKALILVGEPNTGKTTLLRLLSSFLDKQNTSSVSLQKMSVDKFASAQLYNKYANIYDDLSFKDINDNGTFKIATGGGLMAGEFKFDNQFQFENYAKLTFSCNKIPNVKDANDEAYFGRWIVINFNKEVGTVNKFLIDRMTTPEELSGLLNFALIGLQRILQTQDFGYKKSANQIKEQMLRSGSPVAAFAYDCLEEVSGEWVSKEDIHLAYQNYAKERNLPPILIETFGKKLPGCASYIAHGKHKGYTGWHNVRIKDFDQKEPGEMEEFFQKL